MTKLGSSISGALGASSAFVFPDLNSPFADDFPSLLFFTLTWFFVPAAEEAGARVSLWALDEEEAAAVFPVSTAWGTMGECEAADFFDLVLRWRKNLASLPPRRNQLARGPGSK